MEATTVLGRAVEQLAQQHDAAMDLLGEIVACFSMPPNCKELARHEVGRVLLGFANRWMRRYRELRAEHVCIRCHLIFPHGEPGSDDEVCRVCQEESERCERGG